LSPLKQKYIFATTRIVVRALTIPPAQEMKWALLYMFTRNNISVMLSWVSSWNAV